MDSLVSTNSKNIGTVDEIDAAIKNKTNNTLVSALNSLYSKVLSDESNITTLSSKIGTGFSSTNTITTSIQTIQDLIGTSLSVGDGNTTLIKAINSNYTLTTKNQEDIKSINKNLTAAEKNINKNTAAIEKIANESVVKSVTATPASYNTYSLSIVLNTDYKMIVQDDAGNVSYNGTCTFNVADLTDSKTFIVTPLYAKNSVDLSKKNIVVHVDYTVGIQANDDLGVTETKCTVSTTNWI